MAIVGVPAYAAGMDEEGFAPSEAEMRRVLELARAGIARYGFGEELHPADLARPWGNARWQDNAWLRGVRDLLEWVLGETALGPVRGTPAARPTPYDVYADLSDIDEIMQQGSRCPVRPGWPPPQSGEAMDATVHWLDGDTDIPPVCVHGLGAYQCACRDLPGWQLAVSPRPGDCRQTVVLGGRADAHVFISRSEPGRDRGREWKVVRSITNGKVARRRRRMPPRIRPRLAAPVVRAGTDAGRACFVSGKRQRLLVGSGSAC